MELGDIYISKSTKDIIQIDSFATGVNGEPMVIVFTSIINSNGIVGSIPSFNGYGSQETIEEKYSLLVSSVDLINHIDWADIFKKVDEEIEKAKRWLTINTKRPNSYFIDGI